MASLERALDQMLAAGMPLPPDGRLIADGRFHRYGKKARCWYVLHELVSRRGERFVAGAFGQWGALEAQKIEPEFERMDPDEAARLRRAREDLERQQTEKRDKRARDAAGRARAQWNAARAVLKDGEACPYLARKGLELADRLRCFTDGTLAVPAVRYDVSEDRERDPQYAGPRRLVGLQKISPDGTKRFNAGMAKAGAACRLGKEPKEGAPILIVEGVATGLSVRLALERAFAVFVAFDAYNLEPAARILHELYPASPIVFCADDDHATEGNPGVSMATRAAAAVNGSVCAPQFAGERDPKATDFNDLHQAEGLEVVRAQLGAVLAIARARRSEPVAEPDAGGGTDSGKRKDQDPPDWDLHERLLARFVQLYPSDEAFDREIEQIVKIEHMRLMFGKRAVNMWLASKKRRIVLRRNVVFDPTGKVDPATHVNLFRGIPTKPTKDGSCRLLLELLYYLCCEDDAVFQFVLNWLALPLQQLGAKMHTALVFYGDEGAGKNLFFSAIAKIYGPDHAGVISQMQLESQFNEWISAKLFIQANEVVARHEIRRHIGYLKNLVTEPEIWINQKNLSGRWEANHANIVFFSNELHPLQIGPRDRRYLIVRTPGARDKAFYDAVAAEIANGGVEALYQYLLDLDLGDFGVQTKPIETQAKRDLLELGMPASQLFWRDIKDKAIPLPYCPALVSDVYQGYLGWCRRNGEKMPERINRFVPSFMQLNGVRRVEVAVPDPDRPAGFIDDERMFRRRRVLLMGEASTDQAEERARVLRGVFAFRAALREYLQDHDALGSHDGGGSRGFGGAH